MPLKKISRLEELNQRLASRPAGPAWPNPNVSLACADAASSKAGGTRGSWQGRKGPRKGGKNSCRSGRMAGSKARAADSCGADEDSDDEVPLFREKTLNEDQIAVDLNENPWSMDFAIACSNLAWYGRPKDLNATPYPVWHTKEWNTAV